MQTQRRRTVMAVDDDEINLMILNKAVQDSGYCAKSFLASDAAWDYLINNAAEIDIILLDKMMPGIDGIDLLKRIKQHKSLRHIPVIIQTGDAGVSQMREGLESGAFYYLTKPFHPEILTAILHSASNECAVREDLALQVGADFGRFIGFMQEGEFTIKTHDEARVLATAFSQMAIYPEFVAIGLMELLNNAIEHGNLDIGYDRKCKCLWSQSWVDELTARAASPEYAGRSVHVRMEKNAASLHLTIKDEGNGFDWSRYMYTDAVPGTTGGRGLAKALIMLDDLQFTGNGNEVHCNIGIAQSQPGPQDMLLVAESISARNQ